MPYYHYVQDSDCYSNIYSLCPTFGIIIVMFKIRIQDQRFTLYVNIQQMLRLLLP